MKRIIKSVVKWTKILLVGVIVGAAVYFGGQYVYEQRNQPVHVPTATSTPDIIEEYQDVLDESQQELQRIKNELNAEETKLLEEIDEREGRLERIRELRLSFQ